MSDHPTTTPPGAVLLRRLNGPLCGLAIAGGTGAGFLGGFDLYHGQDGTGAVLATVGCTALACVTRFLSVRMQRSTLDA